MSRDREGRHAELDDERTLQEQEGRGKDVTGLIFGQIEVAQRSYCHCFSASESGHYCKPARIKD
jgi:hypothetical protein